MGELRAYGVNFDQWEIGNQKEPSGKLLALYHLVMFGKTQIIGALVKAAKSIVSL